MMKIPGSAILFSKQLSQVEVGCAKLLTMVPVTKIVSTEMVKLNMKVEKKSTPYQLAWVHNGDRFIIREQCLVPFSIGDWFKDQVICDVIPVTAMHLFPGQPWLFDHSVMHDARTNIYTLYQGRTKVILYLHKLIDSKGTPEASRETRELPMYVPSPTQGLLGPYPYSLVDWRIADLDFELVEEFCEAEALMHPEKSKIQIFNWEQFGHILWVLGNTKYLNLSR